MSTLRRIYRGETDYDFVGGRRRWFTLSAALLLIAALGLTVRGFNLSVDFTGGTVLQAPNEAGLGVADVRSRLTAAGFDIATVQLVGAQDDVSVRTGSLEPDEEERLFETLAGTLGVTPNDVSVDSVGPTFGAQITEQAIRALVIFLAAVALFITWRFEWKMALTGLAALFHDLVITAGVYAITGFEVTPATLIAVLTILGYSLYDTVVVYDKVLENVEELGERRTYVDIINLSMNQVLVRSLATSLTSLLPVGSLLFVGSFLLGAGTLREFALALFVGISAGTYSSIFFASPLLAMWKEREERWVRLRRRLERAAAPAPAPRPAESAAGAGRASAKAPTAAPQRPPGTGAVTPRPPKRRRKKRR